MSILDNSLLATQKTTIGTIIDDSSAIGAEFSDNDIETLIYEGLKEMAIYGAKQNVYLNKSATLTMASSSANLPADYLYHDLNAPMQCVNNSNTEIIRQAPNRGGFDVGAKSGLNLFVIEGKVLTVNSSNITTVLLEYIGMPTQLDGSSNTDEFEARMYNYLPYYVIGNLYMRQNAEDEQKQFALAHLTKFYKLIGYENFQERAGDLVG